MADSSDAQDFAAQIATFTTKMHENGEKFERLEAGNTTIRAENAELHVRVETLSTNTTPPAKIPRARFRVPVNPMQPLEEETTPIASNVHQTQAPDPLMGTHTTPQHFGMTTPGMSNHFAGQQVTTATINQIQWIDTKRQTQQHISANLSDNQQPQPTAVGRGPQQTT